MEEPDSHFMLYLEPRFPLSEVEEIAGRLIRSEAIVAGYLPPPRGMLDIAAVRYEQLQGHRFVILPDRNLISRMGKVARGVEPVPFSEPAKLAIWLMAYAQCINVEIEPSIAFHELAHREGNEVAQLELSWFRGADEAQPEGWVDLAMGSAVTLPSFHPENLEDDDLAAPLVRWEKNYVVALKIAALELSFGTPLERAINLIRWMEEDYFLAGPALIYGLMYLGPRAPKGGLFKQLRSSDRNRAVAGIKNASWDMTHLSDFMRRVDETVRGKSNDRLLFASADRSLASIARQLTGILSESEELEADVTEMLSNWWPRSDAALIAGAAANLMMVAANRPPPRDKCGRADPVAEWIEEGEFLILRPLG